MPDKTLTPEGELNLEALELADNDLLAGITDDPEPNSAPGSAAMPENLDGDAPLDIEGLFDEQGEVNEAAFSNEGESAPTKVELDLDGAPFLEDEPAEEAPPPAEAKTEQSLDLPKAAPEVPLTFWAKLKERFKNKKVLAGTIGGLVLVLALLVWLLLPGTPPPPPPPPVPEAHVEETPVPAKPDEIIIAWEPFWIEQTDSEGVTRFVVATFSAPTTNPALKQEADAKSVLIRDAIYYYLSQKPLTYLSDPQNAQSMKSDILGIVNGFLNQGQLEQVLIEGYLIK